MSAANQFGQIFRVTTFGESHGVGIGCVIDGCPAGVSVSTEMIQAALDRRRPGQNGWTSARQELDGVEILSGVLDGRSLGTPIAALVRNQDARSSDYAAVEAAVAKGETARLGHADDQWRMKFGHSDTRGGGRASGRETVARVIAGSVAESAVQAMMKAQGLGSIRVAGYASEIAGIQLDRDERQAFLKTFATAGSSSSAMSNPADIFTARLPSEDKSKAVEAKLVAAVKDGRSYGGVAEIVVFGAPQGLGQPVFHKLKADLAAAYFGVGATSGVEIGPGFSSARAEGTEFHQAAEDLTASPYGGIRGGLSTGEPIVSRISFKPTSTVMDLAKRGRHDPCIVPRAIPVLEAMTWLVLCDHLLWQRLDKVTPHE